MGYLGLTEWQAATLDRKTPGKQANCEGKSGSGRGQLGGREDPDFRRQKARVSRRAAHIAVFFLGMEVGRETERHAEKIGVDEDPKQRGIYGMKGPWKEPERD